MREWLPIETCPADGTPVIFANFSEMCLLALAPHVWTGRYIIADSGEKMMCECSHAAMNENGEPTHWMPLPNETTDIAVTYFPAWTNDQ